VLHTKIAVQPALTVDIVNACCVLHNFILKGERRIAFNDFIVNQTFLADMEIPVTSTQDENWDVRDPRPINDRPLASAQRVRDSFAEYFVQTAPLSWQITHVQRGTSSTVCDNML
jgi:hypothetical protein